MDHQNPYANIDQVGGDHYKNNELECPNCGHKLQHWDVAWWWKWDIFQYNVTKYLLRWRNKNGIEDLKKAAHHLQKYIELAESHPRSSQREPRLG